MQRRRAARHVVLAAALACTDLPALAVALSRDGDEARIARTFAAFCDTLIPACPDAGRVGARRSRGHLRRRARRRPRRASRRRRLRLARRCMRRRRRRCRRSVTFAHSAFLLNGGVQGPYINGGIDYLFDQGWLGSIGVNTLGRVRKPKETLTCPRLHAGQHWLCQLDSIP